MRAIVFLAALLLPTTLPAQSTQPDLEARLLNKPLYLRGLWEQDKLKFDAAGHLENKSATVSFTVAGIDVVSIKLGSGKLTIEGTRIGLMFDRAGDISRIKLLQDAKAGAPEEKIHIQIAAPAGGDFTAALDAVFATDLATLVPAMPAEWQPYATAHFFGQPAQSDPPPHPPAAADPRRIGGGVKPPIVRSISNPDFSRYARANKIAGNVLVYLQVDRQGQPQKIKVLKPVGMGLDEQAMAAVAKYKFSPAMEDGRPVPVEMNVEVNFQIF